MGFLSLLGTAKSVFLNPKVLLGIIIALALIYHYIVVSDLEKNLAVTQSNFIKVKNIAETNANTIISMNKSFKFLKKTRIITETSYIREILKLKGLIKTLDKKIVYKDKIIIKKIKVPVIKEGKTIYINKCADIKVHYLENNETSILKTLSEVGK